MGWAKPDELEQHLTAVELDDWMLFFSMEPWGGTEEWKRSSAICALIANVNRGKGRPTIPMDRFMPQYAPAHATVTQTLDQQRAAIEGIVRHFEKKGMAKRVKRNG